MTEIKETIKETFRVSREKRLPLNKKQKDLVSPEGFASGIPHSDRDFASYHLVHEEAMIGKIDINNARHLLDMWSIEMSEGGKELTDHPEEYEIRDKRRKEYGSALLEMASGKVINKEQVEEVEPLEDSTESPYDLAEWIAELSYQHVDPNINKRSKKSGFSLAERTKKESQKRLRASYARLYGVMKYDPGLSTSEARRNRHIDGWIRVDVESSIAGQDYPYNLQKRLYEKNTGEHISNKDPAPAELTYIKRQGGAPHLMASAVRTVCHLLASQDAEVDRKYYTTATDIQGNTVLIPKRKIIAYVRRGNEHSVKVLQEAGFFLKKEKVAYKEGAPSVDDLYELDWIEFHQIMEQHRTAIEKVTPFLDGSGLVTGKPDFSEKQKRASTFTHLDMAKLARKTAKLNQKKSI